MRQRLLSGPRWSHGEEVLRDPSQNKDAAFTTLERQQLGIEGLLPSAVLTLAQQVSMELEHIRSKQDALEKYIGLIALLDRNETLFFRLLVENLELLTPVLYTPTVGLVCQRFSHIYRRPRGLFLCPSDRGQILDRLRNFKQRDIRLIVVTDNERILGLGDQGAGGMAIPIGKLILYSAGAGIHPSFCLPISLDLGTDNSALLEDPAYVGYRARRLRGPEYDAFLEEFVESVRRVFPDALLQWEDFKKVNAFALLERYAERLPSFNDDIQGTAAVTLAGILSGLALTGGRLRDQRFLIAGSGGAGVGIGRLLRIALRSEGLSSDEVRRRMVYVDSRGIVCQRRADLETHKRDVALNSEDLAALDWPDTLPISLEAIVGLARPTVLIGTTGQPGDFTPGVIRTMAAHCEHPIIMPLSNPTSKAECTPSEVLRYSQGKALVATGSPFEPVDFGGSLHVIGQCNNVFVFPGVGLGALVSHARRVTDGMFLAAAQALAAITQSNRAPERCLYPRLRELRSISKHIAFKVAQAAREEGVGQSLSDDAIQRAVEESCWFPDYPEVLPHAPARTITPGVAGSHVHI